MDHPHTRIMARSCVLAMVMPRDSTARERARGTERLAASRGLGYVNRVMNNPYSAPAPTAPYGSTGSEPYRADDRAEVSDAAVEMLRQTKPWVMFLSIMSFIGSAFLFLGGILVMVAGAFAPTGGAVPTAVLGAIYIPMGFLYIYPALKLWGFSSAIGRLLASRSNMDLEAALGQQKSFWKFAGIVTILMIALEVVFIIGMVVVGVTAAGRH